MYRTQAHTKIKEEMTNEERDKALALYSIVNRRVKNTGESYIEALLRIQIVLTKLELKP